jgi:hypothetical protein
MFVGITSPSLDTTVVPLESNILADHLPWNREDPASSLADAYVGIRLSATAFRTLTILMGRKMNTQARTRAIGAIAVLCTQSINPLD